MSGQNGYWVNDVWVPARTTAPTTGSQLLEERAIDTTRTLVAVNSNGEYIIVDKDTKLTPGQYEWYEDLPSFRYGG